ncbi:Transcription elongation factor A protein 3 [Heterocephalus glaber]|uniref:Transcription elongation factor A protein 3 n=1 Tax=Heterocephalus glaber TaxID=10181 RepID=G5BHY9_HETGA|nr:Transcription elongation factor A protein 3 [Heterocephalus glaber]
MGQKEELLKITKKLEKMVAKKHTEGALDLLKRLNSCQMSIQLLQTTRIGVAVNGVRKQCSDKEVVALAKVLIKNWKQLLDSPGSSKRQEREKAKKKKKEKSLECLDWKPEAALSPPRKKRGEEAKNRSNSSTSKAETPPTPSSPSTPTFAPSVCLLAPCYLTGDSVRDKCVEMLASALKAEDDYKDYGINCDKMASEIEDHILKLSRGSMALPSWLCLAQEMKWKAVFSECLLRVEGVSPVWDTVFGQKLTVVGDQGHLTSFSETPSGELEATKMPPTSIEGQGEEDVALGPPQTAGWPLTLSHIYQELKSTDMKYRNRVRSRISNLKDPRNPGLRRNVLNGAISAGLIAKMTAEEMASDELRKLRNAMTQEAIREHQMAKTGGTTTDLLQCSKCKKKNCTYNQVSLLASDKTVSHCVLLADCWMQTRSADEPMTTFVLCNECGHRWKVCMSTSVSFLLPSPAHTKKSSTHSLKWASSASTELSGSQESGRLLLGRQGQSSCVSWAREGTSCSTGWASALFELPEIHGGDETIALCAGWTTRL